MRKRTLNLNKYGISSKRYKELCGFCEQLPEWEKEIKKETNERKKELEEKINMITKTAYDADCDLGEYIIKSVCYEVPFNYLQAVEEMPCSAAAFSDARRYFFYLLDKKR